MHAELLNMNKDNW